MTDTLKQTIIRYAEERLAKYALSQGTEMILESIALAADQKDNDAVRYFMQEYTTCTVSFRSLWKTSKEREDFFFDYMIEMIRTRKEQGGYEQHIINIINIIKNK